MLIQKNHWTVLSFQLPALHKRRLYIPEIGSILNSVRFPLLINVRTLIFTFLNPLQNGKTQI